jgi:hypothetical protein
MLRKRLTSLLFAAPLLVGLCIAAYKLGPNPSRPVKEETSETAPVAGSAEPAASTQVANGQMFELFGIYQTPVRKGSASVSPGEYLNSLEARYLQRGYRRIEEFDPNRKIHKKRTARPNTPQPIKFFQRDDGNGIANLSATGEDADLDSSEVASEPYTISTLAVPAAGGGTDWATYRIGIDRNKLAQFDQLDRGDFPGNDPAGVPRPQGLQRVYALNSGPASLAIYKSTEKTDVALISLYLEEMPRYGWHLDSAATSAANSIASGVMCFTRGTQSCLVWISPGKQPNTTSVTISSH